ncbi:FimD/PapC C-terminal domain-containing protein [Escherichia coli]
MVPTRGAVVKAEFVTHVGYRVLFRVLNANGKPVPFGAIAAIQDASLADSGIVGDRGELYLLVYQKKDRLRYPGRNASTKCIFNYSLSDTTKATANYLQGVTCH